MMQEAQDLAVQTLASSVTFQRMLKCEGDSVRTARSIYSDVLPTPDSDRYTSDELDAMRPFALVYTPEDVTGFAYVRIATGCWNASGRIAIKLERKVPSTEPATASDRIFRETISGIIKEMAEQRDTEGRLLSKSFSAEGPYRVSHEDVEELGDHQWAFIYVDWGLEAQ